MSAAMQILETLRNKGVNPSGISADSRSVRSGDLFAAMPGLRSDGRSFIAEAVARGAALRALTVEHRLPDSIAVMDALAALGMPATLTVTGGEPSVRIDG